MGVRKLAVDLVCMVISGRSSWANLNEWCEGWRNRAIRPTRGVRPPAAVVRRPRGGSSKRRERTQTCANSADFADALNEGRSDSVVKRRERTQTCANSADFAGKVSRRATRSIQRMGGRVQPRWVTPRRRRNGANEPNRAGNAEDSAAVPGPKRERSYEADHQKARERSHGHGADIRNRGNEPQFAQLAQIGGSSGWSRGWRLSDGPLPVGSHMQPGRSPASGGLIPAEKLSQRA